MKKILKASKDTKTKDTKHADKKASHEIKKAVDAPYTSLYKSPIMEIKDGRKATRSVQKIYLQKVTWEVKIIYKQICKDFIISSPQI